MISRHDSSSGKRPDPWPQATPVIDAPPIESPARLAARKDYLLLSLTELNRRLWGTCDIHEAAEGLLLSLMGQVGTTRAALWFSGGDGAGEPALIKSHGIEPMQAHALAGVSWGDMLVRFRKGSRLAFPAELWGAEHAASGLAHASGVRLLGLLCAHNAPVGLVALGLPEWRSHYTSLELEVIEASLAAAGLALQTAHLNSVATKTSILLRQADKSFRELNRMKQWQLLEQNRILEASNLEMAKELQSAGNLQRTIIPPGPARIPGYDSAWAFHPHGEASGDMFGVFPLDERHAGVFVLDVSGHGMASAMLSFAVSRLLCPIPGQDNLVKRRLSKPPYYEIVPPTEVLKGLRDRFEGEQSSRFYFTLIYAVLCAETGDLEWVSAGHMPPIFARGDECTRCREQSAQTPVGLPIAPHGDEASNRMTLAPGERVFFYSDGLVDIRDRKGLWLPDASLEGAITQTGQLPIARSVDSVIERLERRAGRKSFEDDVTLVALERRGA
jgi:serine phosphatase RsbU (regulator of sigma subunit)